MVHLLKWFKTPCILDSKDWACSTFYINFYSISKNKKEKHFKSTLLSFALCRASSRVAAGKVWLPWSCCQRAALGKAGGTRGGFPAAETGRWGRGGGEVHSVVLVFFFLRQPMQRWDHMELLAGGGSQVTFLGGCSAVPGHGVSGCPCAGC